MVTADPSVCSCGFVRHDIDYFPVSFDVCSTAVLRLLWVSTVGALDGGSACSWERQAVPELSRAEEAAGGVSTSTGHAG